MLYDFFTQYFLVFLLFDYPTIDCVPIPVGLISHIFAFSIPFSHDGGVFVTVVVSVSVHFLTDIKYGPYWEILLLLNYIMV